MTRTTTLDVIQALALPAQARVDQRVPKKLFLEQGAPTSADKRALQEGIEEVNWIAALKPETVAVPAFKDQTREYLEIAVLSAIFRPNAKSARLIELIHRAIPYPLLLLTEQDSATTVSACHKRSSLGEAGKVVLDGDVLAVETNATDEVSGAFLGTIGLAHLPSANLFELYQAWVDRLLALEAACLTGRYTLAQSPVESEARQQALGDHARLLRDIAALRAKAVKETQINRRVEINLAIQRLEAELAAALTRL